jgi:F-type H+-transporting ATPase subunit b
MDINLTLLGEMITFAIFIWFTMRFVWPPIVEVMQKREEQIAEGLGKAAQAAKDLELAKDKAVSMLKEAKADAATVLERAHQRADSLMTEAKDAAQEDAKRLVASSKEEVSHMVRSAKDQLRKEAVELSLDVAGKIIKGLDEAQQKALLDEALRGEE